MTRIVNPKSDEGLILIIPVEDSETAYIGFGRGYVFENPMDLRTTSKALPDGTAISSSLLVAGMNHLEFVLRQAAEYWARGYTLARNRSIDLLLRLTCQRQISKALEVSGIGEVSKVVLYGLSSDEASVRSSQKMLTDLGARRDDTTLELNQEKERFLKKIHLLPRWLPRHQLALILQEKSLGLVFQK